MKKFISLFMIVPLVFLVWVPFAAIAKEEPRVFYYNDFETGYETNETEIRYIDSKFLGDGGIIKRTLNDEGNYVLEMSTTRTGAYNQLHFSKSIKPERKPKLVLEYKLRANLIGASPYVGFLSDYGAPNCFISRSSVMPNAFNDKEIGSVNVNNWTVVTIVYDNESSDRTIFINGKNHGTYSGEKLNYGNTYKETGEFKLNLYAYIQPGTKVEFDYIKVYEYPDDSDPETFDPNQYRAIGKILPSFNNTSAFKIKSDYELLLGMGFYDTQDLGKYQAEAPIKRIDFAVLLARILNIESKKEVKGSYTDITKRHFAAGKLEVLKDLGLMTGISDDTFGVDLPITYIQAVTVLVKALGYEDLANYKGGYPYGFLNVAKEIELTKGFEPIDSNSLTQAECMKLFRKFLEIEVYDIIKIGNDTYTKKEIENGTILKVYHNITILEDIVTSNKYTSLENAEGVSEGKIKVGQVLLSDSDESLQNYLGYKVKVYYNDINDIIASEVLSTNSVMSVSSEEFDKYDEGMVIYNINNKEYNKKIPIGAHIIYNGKQTTFDKKMFDNFKSGIITFIDNNKDNLPDVVNIQSYINRVIKNKNTQNQFISFLNNKGALYLDSDFDQYEILDLNGKRLSLEVLKENSVLSIALNEEYRFAIIYVSSYVLAGTVTEMVNLDGKDYLVINGKDKILTVPGFFEDYPYLTVGSSGDFGLNIQGEIAFYQGVYGKREGFAYLINMAKENQFDDVAMIKMFTVEGKMIISYTGKRLKLDGEDRDINAVLGLLRDENQQIKSQLVYYHLNDNGCITYLDTTVSNLSEDPENSLRVFTSGEVAYNSFNKAFGYNTYLEDKCIGFILPDGDVKTATSDDIQVVSNSGLVNEVQYNFISYKMKNSKIGAEFLVLRKPATESYDTYSRSYIISKITEVVNDENAVVHKVHYYYEGVEKEAYTKDIALFKDVSAGDIVFLKTDFKGQIYTFKMLFDLDNPTGNGVNTLENRAATHRNSFGYAYACEGDLYQFTTLDPKITPKEDLELEIHRIPANIYLYNHKNKKVSIGKKTDLMDYVSNPISCSKIFVYETKGYDYDLVIYN